MNLAARLAAKLDDLRSRGLERSLPPVSHRDGPWYDLGGRRVLGFCSNDYLGFATERLPSPPAVIPASGAGASRLVCGDLPEHRELERAFASLCGQEDAVLFPSGFQLNVGVLPCLLEPEDVVHSDALNHASLIDGIRLSKSEVRVLPHLRPPAPETTSRDWWVCESIYSMDGDRTDPIALERFRDAGGTTYVDEAHAIGLFPGGRGALADFHPTVHVGTLGKAFGCAGAFVASSAVICTWIRTRARSFVFSTGIAPALAHRIRAAIEIVRGPEGDARRTRLWRNIDHLQHALGRRGPAGPIFPVIVGSNALTLSWAAALLERGIHVQPIRPPTVPEGTARLRITLSAAHEPEHIDRLVSVLFDLAKSNGTPLSTP